MDLQASTGVITDTMPMAIHSKERKQQSMIVRMHAEKIPRVLGLLTPSKDTL